MLYLSRAFFYLFALLSFVNILKKAARSKCKIRVTQWHKVVESRKIIGQKVFLRLQSMVRVSSEA